MAVVGVVVAAAVLLLVIVRRRRAREHKSESLPKVPSRPRVQVVRRSSSAEPTGKAARSGWVNSSAGTLRSGNVWPVFTPTGSLETPSEIQLMSGRHRPCSTPTPSSRGMRFVPEGDTVDGGVVYDGFAMPAGVDMRRYRAIQAGRSKGGEGEGEAENDGSGWEDGIVRGRVAGNITDGGIVYDAAAMPRGVDMRAYNATKQSVAKGKAAGSGPVITEWHDGVATGRVRKGHTLDGGVVCEPAYMPPGVRMPRKKGHVASLNTQDLPGGIIGPKSTAGSKTSGFYDLHPPTTSRVSAGNVAPMVDAGVVTEGVTVVHSPAETALRVFTGQQCSVEPPPSRRHASIDAQPRASAAAVTGSRRAVPPAPDLPATGRQRVVPVAGNVEVMDGGVVVSAPTQELFAHRALGQGDATVAARALDVSAGDCVRTRELYRSCVICCQALAECQLFCLGVCNHCVASPGPPPQDAFSKSYRDAQRPKKGKRKAGGMLAMLKTILPESPKAAPRSKGHTPRQSQQEVFASLSH